MPGKIPGLLLQSLPLHAFRTMNTKKLESNSHFL